VPPVAPPPVPAPWEPARWEPASRQQPPTEDSREDAAWDAWEPSSADTPLRVPPLEAPRYTPPPPPSDEHTDPDLLALAEKLGRSTPLVWSRPRRRQHFEATLQLDGTIELADGRRYRNADAAAMAASGSPTADGWGVWRLGAGGPSLLEAFREHFA
jgi:hypothetical protein